MIRVLIADEIARIVGDLEKLEPYADVVDVCGVAHRASAILEEARLRRPDVLVLHEHFAVVAPADLAAQLSAVSPATRVLLMTSGRTSGAAERWAAGTIGDSAPGPELLEAIQLVVGVVTPGNRVTAGSGSAPGSARPEVRAPRGRGSVIVAFSGKGGTGTSMVATNLAVALADSIAGRAALIDIDLQFGDAAAMLHVEHHAPSIADLAVQQGEEIGGAELDGMLVTGPGGLRVLRAPSSPELAETVDAAILRSIIRATARVHAYAVIDTPSQIDEQVLEAFELADRLLLVTSYNLSAVRGTKATLLLLDALGVDPERVDVVLNHTRPRTSYQREDIEEILGRPILVDLPYDPRVDASLDSGTPIVLAEPRAELARRLAGLAELIAAPHPASDGVAVELPVPTAPAYRRRFSLGRR